MRILVVGGSGLIGAQVTAALRSRGHEVTTAARTAGDHRVDVVSASTDRWRPILAGHDGVVFATRSDEQRPLPRPIHPAFRRDIVDPVVRLLTAAREEKLTRAVLMGSYYTHLERLRPGVAARHTYIRSRVEQAAEGRQAAGPDLPVAVLELPFVVGRSGDRVPNWAPALDSWARSRLPLLAPPGGTAVVSADTVATTTVDALERASGEDIPIADENLTWTDLLSRIAEAAGRGRRVGRLPAAALRAALRSGGAWQSLTRREAGLNQAHLADLLMTDLFITPTTGRSLDNAIQETFPHP